MPSEVRLEEESVVGHRSRGQVVMAGNVLLMIQPFVPHEGLNTTHQISLSLSTEILQGNNFVGVL
jgi:hypothetical protein